MSSAPPPTETPAAGPTVALVYNRVGPDPFEAFREVDPTTLDFVPAYPLAVATVQEEYDSLAAGLQAEGFTVRSVNLRERLTPLHALLRKDPPQVVFNLVEFFRDDAALEASVAGVYDLYGVPYTGAPPFALSLCRRKGLATQLLLANGVPTPRYKLIRSARFPRRHGLHYPLIVKPAHEDASLGVWKESVAHSLPELETAIQRLATEHKTPILIEEFIEGREIHAAVLGNNPPRVLPIVEYDFSDVSTGHPPIISYDVKWNPLNETYHQVHEVCPAPLPRRLVRRIGAVALEAFRVTGCRDYARIDMRLTPDGRVYVLEVNPNPDLTESVSFMLAAEASGLSFGATLRRIVECALARAV
jgi:D-alanine-D-alanine ligase